jgi:hypothetical protein
MEIASTGSSACCANRANRSSGSIEFQPWPHRVPQESGLRQWGFDRNTTRERTRLHRLPLGGTRAPKPLLRALVGQTSTNLGPRNRRCCAAVEFVQPPGNLIAPRRLNSGILAFVQTVDQEAGQFRPVIFWKSERIVKNSPDINCHCRIPVCPISRTTRNYSLSRL